VNVKVVQVPIEAGQAMQFDVPEGWRPLSAVPVLLPVNRSALMGGQQQIAPVLVVTLVPDDDSEDSKTPETPRFDA